MPARTFGAEFASYHLSRLYSPDLRLSELVAARRSAHPMAVQQFFNASLGLPYLEEGAGLTFEVLRGCFDDPQAWPKEGASPWASTSAPGPCTT